jgi:methionyl-tRNA formyltransferase
MSKSKRLIFFGNERLSSGFSPDGAPTLQALIDNGYDVSAVVANFESGRSRVSRGLEIEAVATAHGIPVLLPNKLRNIKEQLLAYKANAAVLAAYGKIIPQDIIDIFPHGILNIHPSLLPLYRGSTPIEQAILDGVNTTGVSIMQLVREMDAGPIYTQQHVSLRGNETKQELTEQLLSIGAELIIDVLPRVLDGQLAPKPQDESKATYTSLIRKNDGVLDPSNSAIALERQVRAYAVWPKSRTTIFGSDVIVTKARVANRADDGAIVLTCSPGWLEILELVAPSGKKMSGSDFARGYKK